MVAGGRNVGKTTMLRDMARYKDDDQSKVVALVDKTCELAGTADVMHHAVGELRWLPCKSPKEQGKKMVQAVENMGPQVVPAEGRGGGGSR